MKVYRATYKRGAGTLDQLIGASHLVEAIRIVADNVMAAASKDAEVDYITITPLGELQEVQKDTVTPK